MSDIDIELWEELIQGWPHRSQKFRFAAAPQLIDFLEECVQEACK